jgi:transposase-like protein
MNFEIIKASLSTLSSTEIAELQQTLEHLSSSQPIVPKSQQSRRHLLDNKLGCCPHCGDKKYVKFGIDKGSHRYKCKSCNRSFTEYTGTWMAGLQRKDKIDDYLALKHQEKSLDKIKEALSINKKTAFDWPHYILSALQDTDKGYYRE